MGGVRPDVIAVVDAALVEANAGQNFRQDNPQHVGVFQQDIQNMFPAEDAGQLRQDALRGDALQQRRAPADGLGGAGFDGKPQAGGEAEAPENPQGVLLEPFFRVPHRPQDVGGQVRPPAEGVGQLPPEVDGDGVDGEIPAGQVLRQGTGKLHALRMAVVQVIAVPAEGGDLHAPPAARSDGDGAVLEPGGQGVGGEEGQYGLRLRAGGHIPIPGLPPQQGVPHRAAHAPRLMARALQAAQDLLHIFRYLHRPHPFFRNFIIPGYSSRKTGIVSIEI